MKCIICGKKINPKTDFHFHCDCRDEPVLCGECGIDADTACPKCGAMMVDENEELA